MKIKSFEVQGLFGQYDIPKKPFNEDLNILSGRNGAGKTTVLKLMWYLISGNFDKAVAEIKFKSAQIVTDEYILKVSINLNDQENPLFSDVKFFSTGGIRVDEKFTEFNNKIKNQKVDWFLTQYIGSSFFFPTFRMIEGGFTTEKYDIKHDVLKEFYLKINNNEGGFVEIEDTLKKISNSLSNREHNFVTSISANNIDNLLVKKYASIITEVSLNQSKLLDNLNKQVNLYNQVKEVFDSAESKERFPVEESIKELQDEISRLRNKLDSVRQPIKKVEDMVSKFFTNKDIVFGGKIKFLPKNKLVDIAKRDLDEETLSKYALFTNSLSAGEKQILTFISYNTFYKDSVFFIDEPELSLHADWQRILFRMLKQQNPTNQFIISTHSPFIYSKYPDKEICIDPEQDRGNVED